MSGEVLLMIEPSDLQFPFEPKKQLSCPFQLLNKTDNHVAFKVKTTDPKKYSVKPNMGIVLPRSTCEVVVTMQAQKEAPPGMRCKDKFLLQAVITNSVASPKHINPQLFNKEAGNHIEEYKLKVLYVSPPGPSSPVPEVEEGYSPKAPESELNKVSPDSGEYIDSQDNLNRARTLILKLIAERDTTIQQNDKLRRELANLRQGGRKGGTGFPIVYGVIVALLGLLLGYLLRNLA